jgi:hypothetical protein
MKKALLIGGIAMLVLGAAGAIGVVAYAQSSTPTPYPGFGPGMMGGRAMMGGWGSGSYAPMHDTMLQAVAEALGMQPDELQERLANGETMWQIAEAQGLSADEFRSLMSDARSKALEKAVADGVITQEQADWMQDHIDYMWENGFGLGGGPCDGGWGGRRAGPDRNG